MHSAGADAAAAGAPDSGVQLSVQVLESAVACDRHHRVARPQLGREVKRGGHVQAARPAGEDPSGGCQASRSPTGGLLRDGAELVDEVVVEQGRAKPDPDTLHVVLA